MGVKKWQNSVHVVVECPLINISLTIIRRAWGHGDKGTGPNQVLATTLTLFQPGGQISPTYNDVSNKFWKPQARLIIDGSHPLLIGESYSNCQGSQKKLLHINRAWKTFAALLDLLNRGYLWLRMSTEFCNFLWNGTFCRELTELWNIFK